MDTSHRRAAHHTAAQHHHAILGLMIYHVRMDLDILPHINASLNALAAVLLVVGLVLIRQRRIAAHRTVMISAFGVSCIFLVLYITHKIWKAQQVGDLHTQYNATGLLKTGYLLMLASHIILAMAVPILALWLIWLGLKRNDLQHRRLARIAWPIWMYVSVTGVAIYFMLYHFNPQAIQP